MASGGSCWTDCLWVPRVWFSALMLVSIFFLSLSLKKGHGEGEQWSIGLATVCLYSVNLMLFLGMIEDRKEDPVLLNEASGAGRSWAGFKPMTPWPETPGWQLLCWPGSAAVGGLRVLCPQSPLFTSPTCSELSASSHTGPKLPNPDIKEHHVRK